MNDTQSASFIVKELIRILKDDDSVYILVVDGWECYFFNPYKQSLTMQQNNRIINMGIQEQHTVSFAAGLSMTGKKVYVVMFAAFMTARAYEQIKLDVGYNNANVKLIGIHSGFTGPRIAGVSHWAIEDVALMNAVPNLKIFSPSANKNEISQIMNYIKNDNGPSYLRIDNPGAPLNNLSYKITTFGISQVIKQHNAQINILATGNMVKEAIDIIRKFPPHIKINLYSIYILKPFDKETLKEILSHNIPIVTMEEQVQYGGLSSIVSEQIAINKSKCEFLPICIKDKQYNLVLGDDRFAMDKLIGTQANIMNQILNLTLSYNKNSHKIYGMRPNFDTKGRYSKDYALLGLPLIKIKQFMKNDKPYKSIYFFGIKIISKKA